MFSHPTFHDMYQILLFVLLSLAVSACSTDDSTVTTHPDKNGGISIPSVLTTALPDTGTLSAYIQVDDGTRQKMTIEGDFASVNLTGLTQGEHTFTVEFEFVYLSNPNKPLVLASASKSIILDTGPNALSIDESEFDTERFDEDNDGLSNITELKTNTNPFAGIIVSLINNSTAEDSSTTKFTIVLTSEPSADVSIGISSADTTEGTVDQDILTFTSTNWDTPQTVTVTGVDDNIADGDIDYSIIVATAESTDQDYNGVNPDDVNIINIDDDLAEFNVSTISGNTTETGGNATFTIALSSQPNAEVTIGINSSDTSEGNVDKTSITFSTTNWNIAQVVTVTGVDDSIADGNQTFSIQLMPATSTDSQFAGQDPLDVSVINIDDDSPGFNVSPISGNTSEDAIAATFSVQLNTQPTSSVTINISSSNTDEGVTNLAAVALTPSNWDIAQTVTVTGVDDNISDGNQNYTIILAAAVSDDSNYNERKPSDVNVINTDNDPAPSVTLSLDTTNITEAGGVAMVTATASGVSTKDIVVNLSYSGTATAAVDYTQSSNNIAILAGNTSGTATITALQDTLDEVDENIIVDISSVINGLESGIQQVIATISDDDQPPILEVLETLPQHQSVDVDFVTPISITFSAQIASGSLDLSSISLTSVNGNEEIDLEVNADTLILKPKIRLTSLTEYTVSVSGVTGVDGSVLANPPVTWSFTTMQDIESPNIMQNFVIPAPNATDVDVATVVKAPFSEPILENSLVNNFRLSDRVEGIFVNGLVEYDPYNYTASFSPNARLHLLETYIATVNLGVSDLAGNNLPLPYEWQFTVRDGTWNSADLLETEDNGTALYPKVVMSQDGSGFAIWTQEIWSQEDGSVKNLMARHYDTNSGWGNAEIIDKLDTNIETLRISVSPKGHAMVVWSQMDPLQQSGFSTVWSIFASYYDPDSTNTNSKWDEPQLIGIADIGDVPSLDVALSANGTAMAAWSQYEDNFTGFGWDLKASRFIRGSGWQGIISNIDGMELINNAYDPRVFIDNVGDATIAWLQSVNGVLSARSNYFDNSSTWWSGAKYIETGLGNVTRLELAGSPNNGHVRAVWVQELNGEMEIMTNSWDVTASEWGISPNQVSSNSLTETGDIFLPQIAINPNSFRSQTNQFIIVWAQNDSSGIRTDIWANRYNPYKQTPWGGAQKIENSDFESEKTPAVAIDKRGNGIAVWHQFDGTNQSVRYNRYVGSTDQWSQASEVENNTIRDADFPSIAIDPSGRGIAVWQQSDGQRNNIWFNVFE